MRGSHGSMAVAEIAGLRGGGGPICPKWSSGSRGQLQLRDMDRGALSTLNTKRWRSPPSRPCANRRKPCGTPALARPKSLNRTRGKP